MTTPLAHRFREVHLASAARALMGLSLALLALARSTAIVFALLASYGIGMPLLTLPCRRSCPDVAARMRGRRGDSKAAPRAWATSPARSSAV